MSTKIYLLRHALAIEGSFPNKRRPLSPEGQRCAKMLVPFLSGLGCSAIYTSPFLRAIQTIQPLCVAGGFVPQMREALAESTTGESIAQVRMRMVKAVKTIVASHREKSVLLCTHGGNIWGLLSEYDRLFDFEEYQKLRSPDMRLIVFENDRGWVDPEFAFARLPEALA